MGFFKKTISVSEMGNVLFDITVSKEFHKPVMEHFSRLKGVDLDTVRGELMLLIMVLVDLMLYSDRFRGKYGGKADQVLLQYLARFKSRAGSDEFSNGFIELLEHRSKVYRDIIGVGNASPPTYPYSIKVAETFTKFCGVENDPQAVIMMAIEFGTISHSIIRFVDNYVLR